MQNVTFKELFTPILLTAIVLVSYAFIAVNISPYSIFNLDDDVQVVNTKLNLKIVSPVFNQKSAYFSSPFLLELNRETATSIETYFTIDGSNPLSHGEKWQSPLLIEKGLEIIPNDFAFITSPHWRAPLCKENSILIRAVACNSVTREYSKETVLYFYATNENTNKLPIVSLVMNPEDLYGYKRGIYHEGESASYNRFAWKKWWYLPANYQNRGKAWEKNAQVSFFGFGESEKQSNVKIRVSGNATRSFPQKSLRMDFDGKKSNTYLELPFFAPDKSRAYSMVLKNAGNDWAKCFMRDAIAQKICATIPNLKTQEVSLVKVYMNGAYWGLSYLMNRYNKEYFSYQYGVSEDSVRLIDFTEWPEIKTDKEFCDLAQLEKFLKEDKTSDAKKYEEIEKIIDVDNFTKFICAEVFFANADWPYNNNKCYKIQNKTKWKWVLNDLDVGLGYYGAEKEANQDMLAKLDTSRSLTALVFNGLYQNDSYKKYFNAELHKLLKNEFNHAKAIQQVDSLINLLEPHMSSQMNRWRAHENIGEWKKNCEELKRFISLRHQYLAKIVR